MRQLYGEQTQSQLTAIDQQAKLIAGGFREPVLVLNKDLTTLAANENFCSIFGLNRQACLGRNVYDLNEGAWDLPELRELLETELTGANQLEKKIVFDLEYLGTLNCTIKATSLGVGMEPLTVLTFDPTSSGQPSLTRNIDNIKTIRDILMNAPAAMARMKGPQHVFEMANERYCKLIGKSKIVGKSVKEVLPEIEQQGFIDIMNGVYRTGEISTGYEVPVKLELHNEVRTIYVDFVCQPLRDESGKIDGVFVHAVDITEKVEARKKIEESEKALRDIMDTAPVIIWITDTRNKNIYLNQKWHKYTGQSPENSAGKGWLEVVHPDDRKEVQQRFEKALAQEESFEVVFRLQTVEGKYRWMINQASPRVNDMGKFCGIVGAIVDVHEEVMSGNLIKEKEHRTKSIVEQATVATAVYTGLDMTIELANEAMIKLWGKEQSVIGSTLEEVLPELDGQPFLNILQEVFTTGKTYFGKEEEVKLYKNGKLETGYYNFSYKPLKNEKGEIFGILNMAMEVTDQRLARKKIEESERRYQEIIHSSPALIATFEGENMEIKIANDSILEVWGKGKEIIGKPFLSVFPELAEQGFKEMLEKVYTTGEPYKAYERPVKLVRNGRVEELYFNFVFYPQRDLDGQITGIVDIATEVTPQAVLNKKVKESESHFRQMADLMPEKVINTDPEGNVIYFNQHWLEYTGLSSEELKNQGWTTNIHPKDKSKFKEKWKQSLESGENLDLEIRIRSKEGEYKWHLSRAEAVKDEAGNIRIWIATNTDIQRLKEEEKRKEDFLKMVSHELKTPVTSIKGYVQLLLSLLKTAQERKLSSLPVQPSLERIDHQITRLTRLISEILDLSRIEENKLELSKETFSLNELVDQTVQDIHFTNTQHKIEVFHKYKGHVNADKDRIGQVLINLITNAIKYSPENQEVHIDIHQKTEGTVTVSVRDRGIGIDKENQDRIFQRFYRITEEREDTYSGFGIGLYLANEIVQRHKGYMELQSKKGEGSEFSFTLSETL